MSISTSTPALLTLTSLLLFLLLPRLPPVQSQSSSLAVLYNSSSPLYSHSLLQATFLALTHTLPTHAPSPLFIDLSLTPPPSVWRSVEWMRGNETRSVVSLLDTPTLHQFIRVGVELDLRATVLSPLPPLPPSHSLPPHPHLPIYSLQMSERALGVALLHRVTLMGCSSLLPVVDDPSLLPTAHLFQSLSSIPVLDPMYLGAGDVGDEGLRGVGVNVNETLALLLLSAGGGESAMVSRLRRWEGVGEREVRWFSPRLLPHPSDSAPLFDLYSVVYVGGGDWDNGKRRRLLRTLTQFTGPSPLILHAVLAYDAANLALFAATNPNLATTTFNGMSGQIQFDSEGQRGSDGVFMGVSPVPLSSQTTPLLQPSDWILRDVIRLIPRPRPIPNGQEMGVDYSVVEQREGTSSILTREDLLSAKGKGVEREECVRGEESVVVRTQDPFNQQTYSYTFNSTSLPPHLIIPNQYGFALTFQCSQGKGEESGEVGEEEPSVSLDIACTPNGNGSVHCFGSQVKSERSGRSVWNGMNRDDSGGGIGGMGGYEAVSGAPPSPSSTEEPPSAAPPPPPSQLPQLRQILKAAKPFVGGCIGASTGCAICVLLLGRLSLGALPAVCTGPCFVGTFGTCGGLLGRVFAETTVICTELFRQGQLDSMTLIADAEFGRHLHSTQPLALKGYQKMAAPVVEWMKGSERVTRMVRVFGFPWSQHMTYLMGQTEEWSVVGWAVHSLGLPLCTLVGMLEDEWGWIGDRVLLLVGAGTLISFSFSFWGWGWGRGRKS